MTDALPERCANCGAPLTGRYCSACGQEATPPHLGFHDFAHEALHEFAHVDGKIVQTLRLLVTRPGALTREFLAGKRIRYVSPLRLYLIASAILFAIFFTVGVKSGVVKVTAGPAPKNAHIVQRSTAANDVMQRRAAEAAREPERLNESLAHSFPKAMFVLMPISALLLWPFYRKRQPYYVPHLYFAIHTHAFAFLACTLALLIRWPDHAVLNVVAAIVVVTVVPYFFIALRTVYGDSWPLTIAKGTVAFVIYAVIAIASIAGIVFYSIRTLH